MPSPLADRTYRNLFAAQVISLAGTGLSTVALGLLAYQLASGEAGAVLGTALAIKMVAYVGIAPIVGAYADRLPRRAFLVAMDLVRAAVTLLLPFVDRVWQIYVLIFVLQACSAAFTPTFQATIPDVLPDEVRYTRALSLSRLAYDLENLLSPTVAAALLTVISFHWLFAGDALTFVASAALVLSVKLPQPKQSEREGGVYEKTTRGLRLYLKTPRLRGLLALNLAVAAAGAMVIVNTVVYVKGLLGLGDTDVAVALAASGAGSMLVALALPRLLEKVPDRPVMLAGAGLLGFGLMLGLIGPGYLALLPIWFVLGMGSSAVQTPTGRLLRRSAHPPDRPALFAAQFALSHACWLLTYPLAGWLGAKASLAAAFAVLAVLVGVGLTLAFLLWPADDPEVIEHVHEDLPADHPHLRGTHSAPEGLKHAHAYIIDEHHRHWPA